MSVTHSPVRLSTLTDRVSIRSESGGAKLAYDQRDDWQRKAHDHRVTLTYKRRRYSFDWWQGQAVTDKPTAAECLEALLSEASADEQTFEEWAGELGYDTDSRKAERTHHDCQRV